MHSSSHSSIFITVLKRRVVVAAKRILTAMFAVTNLSRCVPGWCPACCSRPQGCGAGGNCVPSCSSPWTNEASLYLRAHAVVREEEEEDEKTKTVAKKNKIKSSCGEKSSQLWSPAKIWSPTGGEPRLAVLLEISTWPTEHARSGRPLPPPCTSTSPPCARCCADRCDCSGSKLPGSPPAVQ